MASYTPPTETLPIFDNAVFNSVNGSTVLTVSTANLLYLRKTYADTATALETFNAGIATNSIEPLTSTTGSIAVGSNQTSGIINIGTGSTRNATGVINIGTGTFNTNVNVQGLYFNSLAINNRLAPTSGDINFMDLQTSGSMNMGNAGSRSGAVNISNGNSNSSNISIMTGQNNTGQINIANATLGTNTTTVNISNGNQSGAVTIGNSGNNIALNGSVTLAKPLILGTIPTATSQIGYISSNTLSTVTATGDFTLSTLTLPAGIHLITLNVQMNFSVTPTLLLFNFTGTNTSTQAMLGVVRPTSTYSFFCTGSQVVNTTASSYTVFVVNTSGTASSVSGYFQAVRLG